MKSTSTAAAAGAAAGAATGIAVTTLIIIIVIAIALFVLQVIAFWKIFKKAGEPGWKSIIPFYNYYIMIKISWKPMFFWIILGLAVLAGIFSAWPTVIICAVLSIICWVAMAVFVIISYYRLCKSFGHGGGWTVGLIFLETIFILMLGFGKSQYQGNVYLRDKNIQ